MEATVVDLRYHMNDVLKALERNESVSVLYHGKVKGVIRPAGTRSSAKVADHPYFGSDANNDEPVDQVMDRLRRARKP